MQVVKILKADKILTAKAYYAKQKGKLLPDNPYNWNENSIVGILERMDYCGHTVNFKSYSKSHKLKKRIPTTKEQQAVFRNTHEAKDNKYELWVYNNKVSKYVGRRTANFCVQHFLFCI